MESETLGEGMEMKGWQVVRNLAMAGLLFGVGFMAVPPVWAADAEGLAEADASAIHFIKLGAFVIPEVNGNQVTRHVLLEISLEVTGDEKKAKVEHMLPRVKDAVLRVLHRHMSRRRTPDAAQDILKLKRKIRKASNALLGDGMINEVLIENTLERKLL
ncbi:MAG: hypothetical protein COA65_05105 [Rhodospirillaceae bacterium]|nr:MAG: hypothetical protein COA65_05105 [Rhodospirillaceae bacterium]